MDLNSTISMNEILIVFLFFLLFFFFTCTLSRNSFSTERFQPTCFLSKNETKVKRNFSRPDPGSRSVLIMNRTDGYRESARFIIERETQ